MDTFSAGVARARHGREARGAAPGRRRYGRGVQPAQAKASGEQDATVRAGTATYRAVTGAEPADAARPWLGVAAHYAFGAAAALADETPIPALGLSRGPRDLSPGVHPYALTGHVAYGAALEATRRLLVCR
jgi:hypothetical protein